MKNLYISLLLLCSIVCCSQASDDVSLNLKNNVTILSADNQSISMNFEISELEIHEVVKDNQSFDSFAIPGEGTTYDYGRPLLPAISRFVVVPSQSGLSLVIETDEPRIIKASNPPAICDDEELTSSNYSDLPDDAIYPPIIAEMSEPTIIRGVRLVKITTYPLQYNSVTNEYIHRPHIRTDIVTTGSEPVNPTVHSDNRRHSDYFLRYIEDMAINGSDIRRDNPGDVEPPYNGHYAIATNDECLPYIIPFIEWRRKAGYKVDVLSFRNGGAAGNASGIRTALQNLYDEYLDNDIEPFDLLLLVGDRTNAIGGVGWILGSFQGNSTWGGAPHADYEFGLLEGNDNHPDVGIGRWWSGNQARLELAVGRTVRYEADPYMGNTDWFNSAGAFSQHWGNQAGIAWHITIHTIVRWEKELLEHLGYEDVRFYEHYDWDQR
ncbi:MAG: hypothetical protein HQ568_05030, partial [Calditrichaeota bacterium]|nr:hypothetical protein [Calditrichota bacterium]